jgi:glycosyltransferase involved in cell wall biosynthesis
MANPKAQISALHANFAPGPHYEADAEGMAVPRNPAVKLISFYLPQFHPIPENDQWWGAGFTEWTNVTKAVPQFEGHHQPQLPGELGFYDLRLPEILRRQAALARKYGIFGFCFHYYWFGGRRLLETPLNLLLGNSDIDLPFCICWANENWTRRWDGLENEVLMAQNHSPEDDIDLAKSMEPMLRDARYICIDGRPLIILYRPGLLPNALATARRWRAHFSRAGLADPYLVMVQGFGDHDPRIYGFDAAVEFPPHKLAAGLDTINCSTKFYDDDYQGMVFDYEELIRRAAAEPPAPYRRFRGVSPSWDNEARKPGRGHVYAHSTPEKYARWLTQACEEMRRLDRPDERLVFINAWNEWAEGAHLEPDRHFGYAYLQATARVLTGMEKAPAPVARRRVVLVSHDAHLHGAQMLSLHLAQTLVQDFGVDLRVILGAEGELEGAFRQIAPTERIESGFADLGAWLDLGRRLQAQGFTSVLCNTTVSAQAVGPLRAAGLRVICLVHELPVLIKDYGLVDAARNAAETADAVVFPSAFVRDRFVDLVGPIARRCIIRPQGMYLPAMSEGERLERRSEIRRTLGVHPGDRVILGVGYGDRRKGLDLWPELIRRVAETCPEAVFVWVGRTDQALIEQVRRDLEGHKLADRLRLPGQTLAIQDMYAAADLFALTSREDPFPNVVLEAMAYGLPVVAFEEASGIADIVRETGARLAPYLDVAAMADEVCRLIGDTRAYEAISTTGRQRIAQNFDFRRYASDLLRLAAEGPTVSVVVPNYNYARYLRQRCESIWSQTYPVHEVILLDDASTDGSVAVIDALEREGAGRLRVVRNDANSGSVSRQWARGVAMATGDLVWIAEADDFAEPQFLETLIRAFADPEVVLSYCQSRQIDSDGRVLAEHYLDYVADVDPALWRTDYQRPGTIEIAEALSVKNTIPNASAVLFRRDVLAGVLADHVEEMTTYRNAADWLCYMHVLREGAVAFAAATLNNHRRHARSVTLAAVDRQHLDEIEAMQRLAALVALVRPERQAVAARWVDTVAIQFGLKESSHAG